MAILKSAYHSALERDSIPLKRLSIPIRKNALLRVSPQLHQRNYLANLVLQGRTLNLTVHRKDQYLPICPSGSDRFRD